MRRILVATAAAAAFLIIAAAPAAAARSADPPAGCWGELSRDLAHTGTTGEHASSFDEPRVGLANIVPGGISALCEFLGG